jgi:hypothetical protein
LSETRRRSAGSMERYLPVVLVVRGVTVLPPEGWPGDDVAIRRPPPEV